jgi:hypothetical protein
MAKYKVGDKVVIRKDLKVGVPYGTKTFVSLMKAMCDEHDYILTIKTVREDDVYYMEEDETWMDFAWTDEMIEKLYVVDTDTKFEAFLKEVVDVDCDGDLDAWNKIRNLVQGRCGDSKEETIQWLADFYSKFVPMKKMTKAEIDAELGYKIEIVEE